MRLESLREGFVSAIHIAIPFAGWRVINVDNDGAPCESPTHWQADAFEIEWLGLGAVLFIGKVYPASRAA